MDKNKYSLLLVANLLFNVILAQSGDLLWSVPSTQLPLGGATWSTPVIMNNRLYFQGQDGSMVCLNAQTGVTIWMDSVNFNPVIHHPTGKCGVIYTSNGTTFISVEGIDGAINWQVPLSNVHDGTPILGTMIYVATTDTVYGLSINSGATIWKRSIQSTYLMVANDGSTLFTTSSSDASLYALDPGTGSTFWSLLLSDTLSNLGGMALSGDILVIASEENFANQPSQKYYGINVNTKTEIWAKNGYGYSPGAPPVIMGDKVFISTRFSAGPQLQMVRAHDLATGDSLWAKPARMSLAGRTPIITALDGKVFYENSEPGVYPEAYICADSSAGDTLWTTVNAGIANYFTWGGLIIHNNKLYGAMDGAGIYCFDAGNIDGQWPVFGGNLYATNSFDSSLVSYGISGIIYDKSKSSTIDSGKVYLYKYGTPPSPMQVVDSSVINGGGGYEIYNIQPGDYLVQANPENVSYPNGVTSYQYNEYSWEDANVISISKDTTLDIIALGFVSPTGVGSISGKIVKGNIGKMNPGDPYRGADISLIDRATSSVTICTLSDSTGNFSFSDIPTGSYSIYVDVAGVPVDTNTYNVTTINNVVTSIVITVDSTEITFGMQSGISSDLSHDQLIEVFAYPVPASTFVYFRFEMVDSKRITIEMFNMLGKKEGVLFNDKLNKGEHTLKVDLTDYPRGIYFYDIKTNLSIKTGKLIIID